MGEYEYEQCRYLPFDFVVVFFMFNSLHLFHCFSLPFQVEHTCTPQQLCSLFYKKIQRIVVGISIRIFFVFLVFLFLFVCNSIFTIF